MTFKNPRSLEVTGESQAKRGNLPKLFGQVAETKIWCYGPETGGANLLVDATANVENLDQIKVIGFQQRGIRSVFFFSTRLSPGARDDEGIN